MVTVPLVSQQRGFFYEPRCIAAIEHRCVALFGVQFNIVQSHSLSPAENNAFYT